MKNKTIETAIMTPELLTALQRNHVNFSENYYNWGKQKMVEKIGIVMGIEHPSDPDPSYVLTVDNVIKILAILMKFRYTVCVYVLTIMNLSTKIYDYESDFRCSIPVVVMGETGCGKTRLIRYMCDLAAQGGNKERSQDSKCIKNLLIMKVEQLIVCIIISFVCEI